MILILLFSILSYDLFEKLPVHGFWFWIVRLPEFVVGMYFYSKQKYIINNMRRFIKYTFLIVVVFFLIDVYKYDNAIFIDRWLPLNPRSFLISIPLIIFIFLIAAKINNKYNLFILNKYSQISYVFMLLQHVVINVFVKFFEFEKFSSFGILFIFILICLVTVYLSQKIRNIYKPIEDYLLNK